MAVKVMLAPAIARREEESALAKSRAPAEAKPKRRRSSVYDAQGNEVFITLMCLKCHHMRPLSHFGLRRMADGAIRNQPWCRTCRSGASAANPRRRKGADAPAEAVAEAPGSAEKPVDPGALAAQVVAALHNGRG
ncbi:MAG TPA: hypothetical protein VFP65_11010 [Anaeromyxobacteraceae bacterium]|nr:hypothetical protein [Anaeromyxobacteraceae bacterium]